MDIPVDPWYKAIFVRRSRRSLLKDPPARTKLDTLQRTCSEFRPFPDIRAELIREPGGDVFKGIIGSYGRIRNISCYVAFIGDIKHPKVQESVGYMGEGIILQATVLGLATCWVGGFFRPEAVKKHLSLQKQEKVLAVTPVGIAKETYSIQERVMSGLGHMHRRKPLSKMVSGNPNFPWMFSALEAARLAPSAVNRQPWRFVIRERSIAVTVEEGPDSYNIKRRLDCGIAMLHLEVGARYAGAVGAWSFPPDCLGVFTADSIDLKP